jgi:oxygen-dependent protoporphyrinogen oxidase
VEWPDGQVRRAVVDDIAPLLRIRQRPLLATVRRHPRAMPQYELGHLARIDRIERLVARLPGLALAGNAYHGAGIAHCIHSGELAAHRVKEQLQKQQVAHAILS